MLVHNIKYYKNRILIECNNEITIKIKYRLNHYEFKFCYDDFYKPRNFVTYYCGFIGYSPSKNGKSIIISGRDEITNRPTGLSINLRSRYAKIDFKKLVDKIYALDIFKRWDKAVDHHDDILEQVIQDTHKKLIKSIKANKTKELRLCHLNTL